VENPSYGETLPGRMGGKVSNHGYVIMRHQKSVDSGLGVGLR